MVDNRYISDIPNFEPKNKGALPVGYYGRLYDLACEALEQYDRNKTVENLRNFDQKVYNIYAGGTDLDKAAEAIDKLEGTAKRFGRFDDNIQKVFEEIKDLIARAGSDDLEIFS